MSHIKGQVNTTQRGYSCQHWQTNSPHEVKIKPKNADHNYCRNPDGDPRGPWCYTTSEIKWDYCFIPECECVHTCLPDKSGFNQVWDQPLRRCFSRPRALIEALVRAMDIATTVSLVQQNQVRKLMILWLIYLTNIPRVQLSAVGCWLSTPSSGVSIGPKSQFLSESR